MANSALKSSPSKLFFAVGKEKEKYIVSSLAFSKTFKPSASICFLNDVILMYVPTLLQLYARVLHNSC